MEVIAFLEWSLCSGASHFCKILFKKDRVYEYDDREALRLDAAILKNILYVYMNNELRNMKQKLFFFKQSITLYRLIVKYKM